MKYLLVFLLVTFCFVSYGQDLSLYKKEILAYNYDSLPYRILLPENFDATKKYPLIIFLHGSGERGNDNEAQLIHGANLFLADSIRKKFPAIVVFPQCPQNSFWSNVTIKEKETGLGRFKFQSSNKPTTAMIMLEKLLKKLQKEFVINKKQIYVGGLSMGGMGTFELVYRNPKMFAAAFPICGGADVASASKFTKTSWWIFHGAKDDIVDPGFSIKIVFALQQKKADVKFSLYPEANHNSWDSAFAEPELMSWLFSKHK